MEQVRYPPEADKCRNRRCRTIGPPAEGLKHRTRDGGCVEDRRGTRDDGRKAKVIKISHKETEVRWRRSDDRGKT